MGLSKRSRVGPPHWHKNNDKQYGCIHGYDRDLTHVITDSGKANKVKVTAFNVNDPSSGEIVPDQANDQIIVNLAGHYEVNVVATVESAGGVAIKVGIGVWKDDGAVEFTALHSHRDLAGGGGDTGFMGCHGYVTLEKGDRLSVYIWNETNGDDIIMSDITMSVDLKGFGD